MPSLTLRRRTSKARYFREALGEDIHLDMTLIPAGEFWMGTSDDEIERLCEKYPNNADVFRREAPQHFVSVKKFYLGRYPITQGQYQAVMGKNPSSFDKDFEETGDALQRPVESVSWDDAQEFCTKLQDLTGKPFRLPTEAEWEYACRGIVPEEKGAALTQGIWNERYHQAFHFGEMISDQVANYRATETYGDGEKGEYRKQTTPVGSLNAANNFGLSDMHGNVFEWCEDDWHENYEKASGDASAYLKEGSRLKIRRGGSWGGDPRNCRSAYRSRYYRDFRYYYYGFRVAVSPQ